MVARLESDNLGIYFLSLAKCLCVCVKSNASLYVVFFGPNMQLSLKAYPLNEVGKTKRKRCD